MGKAGMHFWRAVLVEWNRRGALLGDYEATVGEVALRYPDLINEYNESGFTPIHLAILNKDVGCVRILIDHGADIYLPTRTPAWETWDGLSAIELARSEYMKVVEMGGVGGKDLEDHKRVLDALIAVEEQIKVRNLFWRRGVRGDGNESN